MKLTLTLLILIKKIKSKKIEGKSSGKWGKTQKKIFFNKKSSDFCQTFHQILIRFQQDSAADSDKIPHQILTRIGLNFGPKSDLACEPHSACQTCLVRFVSDSDEKSDKCPKNVWRMSWITIVRSDRDRFQTLIRIWYGSVSDECLMSKKFVETLIRIRIRSDEI